MRAIETIGTIDAQGHIQLDTPHPEAVDRRVRIIMLLEEDDLAPSQWENAIATNSSFAFLNDPEEDIYTLADGKPVSYEG
ncbi:hypothetical protein ACN4EG_22730 [Alkalinema pantanalense CENA528]|uniref:hypothetical protein n=1 Tax=Alkalinema pantanalense TaxID=1620705 RepID=UPI003D6FE76F